MRSLKLVLCLGLLSLSAMAAAATVKIDSYTYTEQNAKTAELCGTVTGATSTPSFVQITVDHTSKQPAIYNAIANANGKFCAVVLTYYGTASVTAL
jgi:P pilus assembly chaperone PapD